MNDELISIIKPLARTAIKLNLSKIRKGESIDVLGTRFGGAPYAEKGETWPSCSSCQRPLTFICQIDLLGGFHQSIPGIALSTFFYCWECSPWGLDDEAEGMWSIRTYAEPRGEKSVFMQPPEEQSYPTHECRVEKEQVLSFPDWDDLYSVSKNVTELSAHFNGDEPWEPYNSAVESLGGLTNYATVIGGYPRWIQGESEVRCDQCHCSMNLLAQIDSEEKAGIMWGDAGCVYFLHCAAHPKEIKLYLQCY